MYSIPSTVEYSKDSFSFNLSSKQNICSKKLRRKILNQIPSFFFFFVNLTKARFDAFEVQRVTLSFFFRRIVRWHNYRYGITCTHEATHLLNTQRAAITKVCHTEYTHMHTHTQCLVEGESRDVDEEGCLPLRESSSFGLRYGLIGLNVCATLTALRGTWQTIFEISDSKVWNGLAGGKVFLLFDPG